ncbi:LysR family transcriptional regulator [Xylophilus rhododendri]|uniref:LysR family transcriptional regulator n=1 Tax=Xylophilus rhododendri TaxID=2697032 RepID=A0A857JBC9_9BURK|nr:LysR family transcriptional regulator [Xylophilus rhododendri]QHJ00360.1 LysR family transcriptional regulator [Xylophilus rhododendri]
MQAKVQLRVRFLRDDSIALGPGKVDMLQAVALTGSISAAARQMGMSYKRAWTLIEEINQAFKSPAVAKSAGGSNGGGASLTPLGEELVKQYRALEDAARLAGAAHISAIHRLLAP